MLESLLEPVDPLIVGIEPAVDRLESAGDSLELALPSQPRIRLTVATTAALIAVPASSIRSLFSPGEERRSWPGTAASGADSLSLAGAESDLLDRI